MFRRLAVQQQQQLETVKTKWRETLRFMQGYAGAKEWGEALGSDGFAERLTQARQALNELEAVDAQYRRTLEECVVLTAAAEGRMDPESHASEAIAWSRRAQRRRYPAARASNDSITLSRSS